MKGVFEKAGIEPQVKRLGKYKSAGDQLARKDMSEPQKEQLTALLDDIYAAYKSGVAAAVGKSEQEVHPPPPPSPPFFSFKSRRQYGCGRERAGFRCPFPLSPFSPP